MEISLRNDGSNLDGRTRTDRPCIVHVANYVIGRAGLRERRERRHSCRQLTHACVVPLRDRHGYHTDATTQNGKRETRQACVDSLKQNSVLLSSFFCLTVVGNFPKRASHGATVHPLRQEVVGSRGG